MEPIPRVKRGLIVFFYLFMYVTTPVIIAGNWFAYVHTHTHTHTHVKIKCKCDKIFVE